MQRFLDKNGLKYFWNKVKQHFVADKVSFDSETTALTSDTVQGAIEELFTSVSDGKKLIASAITDKGVQTSKDATFQTIANNISKISSGDLPSDVFRISLTTDPPEVGAVTGGGYASSGTILTVITEVAVEIDDGFLMFDAWYEDGEVVEEKIEYRFLVEKNRFLTAKFKLIDIKDFVWWSPLMTSNTEPYPYHATSNGIYNPYYEYLAFDGVTDKNMKCYCSDGRNIPWIQIDFGNRKIVYGIRLFVRNSYLKELPKQGIIKGSNDGDNFDEILSFSGLPEPASNHVEEFIFAAPVNYRYYKLDEMQGHGYSNNPNYVAFVECEFLVLKSEHAEQNN